MKAYFLPILIVFILNQTASTQVIEPFPKDSASWHISYTCYDGGVAYYSSEIININGDTIINGQTYTILENEYGIEVLTRTNDKKVYFKNYNGFGHFPDTSDVLIYDFGLKKDSIFHYPDFFSYSPDSVRIDSVDTIQLPDGINRKRLKLSTPFQNICGEVNYWIEGIGSEQMPFYFRDCFECSINGFEFWRKDI